MRSEPASAGKRIAPAGAGSAGPTATTGSSATTSRHPSESGATGRAITPLRTVAVDTTVIPLGTPIFVQEFRGLPRPDGTPHDGCFLAEDRGLKVRGRQIDVFTGDPALTARWNALMPSNHGVHVNQNDPRCRNGS